MGFEFGARRDDRRRRKRTGRAGARNHAALRARGTVEIEIVFESEVRSRSEEDGLF